MVPIDLSLNAVSSLGLSSDLSVLPVLDIPHDEESVVLSVAEPGHFKGNWADMGKAHETASAIFIKEVPAHQSAAGADKEGGNASSVGSVDNSFTRAVLDGKVGENTSAGAKLVAQPQAVLEGAEKVGESSAETAAYVGNSIFSRILGLGRKDSSSASDLEPGQNFFSGLFHGRAASLKLQKPQEEVTPVSFGEKAASVPVVSAPIVSAASVKEPLSRSPFILTARPYFQMGYILVCLGGLLAYGAMYGPWTFWGFVRGSSVFWGALLSVTLHELGHAWVADREGDLTPRNAGQLSINPLRFTSPLGATLLFVTGLMGAPAGFFATNVQDSLNKPENKAAMSRVALAGPMVNFLLSFIFLGMVVSISPWAIPALSAEARDAISYLYLINALLAMLNMLPLAPLDGHKVFRVLIHEPGKQDASEAKAGPVSRLDKFDTYALWVGVPVILFLTGFGLYFGVKNILAGKLLEWINDPYTFAILCNGMIVWLAAMFPALDAVTDRLPKFVLDKRILRAGGVSVLLSLPIIVGKSPKFDDKEVRAAVPWSGSAAAKERITGSSYELPFDEVRSIRARAHGGKALRLDNGSQVALDERMEAEIDAGRWLLLREKKKGSSYALLPAQALGGPAEVLKLAATALVARGGGIGKRRRLLSREEAAVAIRLSKALKMPVYELDYTPVNGQPRLATPAMTEQGPAFFLRTAVLSRLAMLPEQEREKRAVQAEAYLQRINQAFLAGEPVSSAEQSVLAADTDFEAWLARVEGGIK
ncbi:MAG: site-2 protease family protein [Elusimicrobiota bacterium]